MGGRPAKNITVSGLSPDDDLFCGSLIFRVGLDLTLVEELEKAKKTRYDEIIPYMRSKDITPEFDTPKHHCILIEDVDNADAVVFVVNAITSKSDLAKALDVQTLDKIARLSTGIVVAVDKMHEVDWQARRFNTLAENATNIFEERGVDTGRVQFVPVSTIHGDNLLFPSENTPWITEQDASGSIKLAQTVIAAIDT